MTQMKRSFADHGSEKMIFDTRMGPQALYHEDTIYVVYQASQYGQVAHPHIIAYDCDKSTWSEPLKLGNNPARYDHHKGPIIWMDDVEHLHVLYGCHITPGTHLVATAPRSIADWRVGSQIAETISYPTIAPIYDNKWLMFYRGLGHMGFWAYRLSDDGGHSWSEAQRVIDFDYNPRADNDADSWAGSYVSVRQGLDGRSLHIGFVYWDERRNVPHPAYDNIGRRSKKRYNLYYLILDIPSRELRNIDGETMVLPVNRAQADASCKVMDTGWGLSNMPSVSVGPANEPYFVLPISDKSPFHCWFYFVAREGGAWSKTPITATNGNWAGCFLCDGRKADCFTAYLVTGVGSDHEELLYSGGTVEQWQSDDRGRTWRREQQLIPEPGLIYNNPKPVPGRRGELAKEHLVFFGWEGPGSIQADPSPNRNRGRAFMWRRGEWL